MPLSKVRVDSRRTLFGRRVVAEIPPCGNVQPNWWIILPHYAAAEPLLRHYARWSCCSCSPIVHGAYPLWGISSVVLLLRLFGEAVRSNQWGHKKSTPDRAHSAALETNFLTSGLHRAAGIRALFDGPYYGPIRMRASLSVVRNFQQFAVPFR